MISSTAIVKDAEIGTGTKIWEFANLYGCLVGQNCNIGSYVEIQCDVSIGNWVVVSSHSFICSKVIIEDEVFIGHGVMTINDTHPPSFRKTGSKEFWKPTLIRKGAVIGSNSTIFPVVIGKNAVVGAGAVVLKDVPDDCMVVGNPARIVPFGKE